MMADGRLLDMTLAFIVGAVLSPWLLIWFVEISHRSAVQRANREIEQERRGKPVPRVN
jgi:hypothetical protein